jgi:(p)ppGpp synthase/HD superfamily hydrolase
MNRETFFKTLADKLKVDELTYVQRMYWLVKDAHRRQSRRLTGERYFEHVRRVSLDLAVTYGYWDAMTIAEGLGHDLIEDTFVLPSIIVDLFGQELYDDILSLSKDLPSFNPITGHMIARAKVKDDSYYQSLAIVRVRPRRVKGCDRIDNLADLAAWEPARREKYIIETRTKVLPIVLDTDIRMAAEIERRLVI